MSTDDILIDTYFKIFDKDGDGKMSTKELKNLLKVLYKRVPQESEIQSKLREFDVDASGTLDLEEFKKLYNSITVKPKGTPLLAMFKKYDKNGDDSLNIDEVRQFLEEVYPDKTISEDMVTDLMNEVDTNRDGSVSFKVNAHLVPVSLALLKFCMMFIRCYTEEQ